jgi:small redox-active disulfide protein 2
MSIKILGSGCSKCNKLEKLVKEILKDNNLNEDVQKIETLKEIMSYGVMTTPALVIDDKVIFSGKIPSKKELIKILVK